MCADKNESTSRVFKVALVGYGLAGKVFHGPLVSAAPNMVIDWVVTTNPDRQADVRNDFPNAAIVDKFEKLFEGQHQPDLVVIASPNDTHAPYSIYAMERGAAVVVDKPMAITSVQCEEMIATSKRTGKVLTIFHNRRWDGDFLTVSQLVRSGTLGTIVRYESAIERWRPAPKPGAWRERLSADDGGGLLFDLGSHLIDQAIRLFGDPLSVFAEMHSRRDGVLGDDDTFVSLDFKNSVSAHISMTNFACKQGPRFRVMGTKGSYEKYGFDPQEDALRSKKSPSAADWGKEIDEMHGILSVDKDGIIQERIEDTMRGQWPTFYAQVRDAITNGAAPPVEPSEVASLIRVLEAAKESAKTGTRKSIESQSLVAKI